MKLLVAVIFLALASPALAVDGGISFTDLAGSTSRDVAPTVSRYQQQIELGQRIGSLRPYIRMTTLMDGVTKDVSFHPISIQYEVGATYQLPHGYYLDITRMCDHVVDGRPNTGQYWGFKAGWNFDSEADRK